jgi:hypothetical protein
VPEFLKRILIALKNDKSPLVLWSLVILIVLFAFSLPRPLFSSYYSPVLYDRNGKLLGAMVAHDGQWRFPESLGAANNGSRAPQNQQPRPKGTGYVASPEELHSGFNTFYKRPTGRGIKPLSTNKNSSFNFAHDSHYNKLKRKW